MPVSNATSFSSASPQKAQSTTTPREIRLEGMAGPATHATRKTLFGGPSKLGRATISKSYDVTLKLQIERLRLVVSR